MDKGPYGKKGSYSISQKCDNCGTSCLCNEENILYVISKNKTRKYSRPSFICSACELMIELRDKIPWIVEKRIQRSYHGVVTRCDNKNCLRALYLEDTKPYTSPIERCCFSLFRWNPFPETRYFQCKCGKENYLYSSSFEHSTNARLKEMDRDERLNLNL